LSDDGRYQLVTATPIWAVDECHWCGHKWIIGVYNYHKGKFAIDSRFNNSLLFPTLEKYDFYDIHGYRRIPSNLLGVISFY